MLEGGAPLGEATRRLIAILAFAGAIARRRYEYRKAVDRDYQS